MDNNPNDPNRGTTQRLLPPIRFLLPTNSVAQIIGRSGSNLKEMMKNSKATIFIGRESANVPQISDRIGTIIGTRTTQTAALEMIMKELRVYKVEPTDEMLILLIPESCLHIIDDKIQRYKEQFKVKICIENIHSSIHMQPVLFSALSPKSDLIQAVMNFNESFLYEISRGRININDFNLPYHPNNNGTTGNDPLRKEDDSYPHPPPPNPLSSLPPPSNSPPSHPSIPPSMNPEASPMAQGQSNSTVFFPPDLQCTPPPSGPESRFIVRLVVPHDSGLWLVGKGGENVRTLSNFTGSKIQMEKESLSPPVEPHERIVRLSGGVFAKLTAVKYILDELYNRNPNSLNVIRWQVTSIQAQNTLPFITPLIEKQTGVQLQLDNHVKLSFRVISIAAETFEQRRYAFFYSLWLAEKYESNPIKAWDFPGIPFTMFESVAWRDYLLQFMQQQQQQQQQQMVPTTQSGGMEGVEGGIPPPPPMTVPGGPPGASGAGGGTGTGSGREGGSGSMVISSNSPILNPMMGSSNNRFPMPFMANPFLYNNNMMPPNMYPGPSFPSNFNPQYNPFPGMSQGPGGVSVSPPEEEDIDCDDNRLIRIIINEAFHNSSDNTNLVNKLSFDAKHAGLSIDLVYKKKDIDGLMENEGEQLSKISNNSGSAIQVFMQKGGKDDVIIRCTGSVVTNAIAVMFIQKQILCHHPYVVKKQQELQELEEAGNEAAVGGAEENGEENGENEDDIVQEWLSFDQEIPEENVQEGQESGEYGHSGKRGREEEDYASYGAQKKPHVV